MNVFNCMRPNLTTSIDIMKKNVFKCIRNTFNYIHLKRLVLN